MSQAGKIVDAVNPGTVVGPGVSIVGDIATWNNITGTLLADSGVSISTDGTFAADSDALSPTQKATKTYVDTAVAGATLVGTANEIVVGGGAISLDPNLVFPGNASLLIGTFIVATIQSDVGIDIGVTLQGGSNFTIGGGFFPELIKVDSTAGSVMLGKGQIVSSTSPGAYPYDVLTSDYVILVDTSVARTIRLPDAPTTNSVWIIKDAVGSAGANNITVTTVGGVVLIDGAASQPINTNYESFMVIFTGAAYSVL